MTDSQIQEAASVKDPTKSWFLWVVVLGVGVMAFDEFSKSRNRKHRSQHGPLSGLKKYASR